jgi:hypothetical protein
MAFVDDPNKNTEETQVAGAAPLSNEASMAPTAPEQADMSGSTAPMTSGGSTPATTNKKAPKASSGTFTNIQKYVDKNKPQAQKMAESSLEGIRKTQENVKKQQQSALQDFTTTAQASGLQNTEQQVGKLKDYTSQQAGLTTAETPAQMTDRQFQDIINAKYSGPRNLTETGNIYQQSLEQADKAGRVGELAQSAQGREQLLREQNTRGGKQYTQGASQLDNLLLGRQADQIGQMEAAGRDIGSSRDLMSQLSGQASDVAGQTAEGVAATKNLARQEFANLAAERQGQVDSRVGDVIENWDKLPAHFRETLSKPDGTVDLSKVEAATLGIQSGEGLYNLSGEDLFGTAENPAVAAERARLISQGEQGNLSRLQALSNLAQTDEKLYDIGDYFNEDLAGTQSAFDALNLEGVRDQLSGAEQAFRRDAAIDKVGRGKDYERYKRGWGQSRGKAHASATQTGNLKDILAAQGYDFGSDIQTEDGSNVDVLKALSEMSKSTQNQSTTEDAPMADFVGEDPTDLWSNLLGSEFADYSNVGGLEAKLAGLSNEQITKTGDAIQDTSRQFEDTMFGGNDTLLGNLTTDPVNLIGKGISDIGGTIQSGFQDVFGGGKSGAKKKAQASADRKALADLKAKLSGQLQESGFSNRANVADTEATQARDVDLMELLKNLDTTNR